MAKSTVNAISSERVLQDILEGMISIFQHANVGIIYIFDPDTGYLRMDHCHNISFDTEYPYLKVGEGVSGKVFNQGQRVILNGSEVFNAFIDRPSTFMRSFESSNYVAPYGAMSMPLTMGSKKLVVVTIYNYDRPEEVFSDQDMELMQVAADHATIVIKQSMLIKEQERALKELEKNNCELSKMMKVQRAFTKISLTSNHYEPILGSISESFAVDVLFLDPYFTVIDLVGDKDISLPPQLSNHKLLKHFSISNAKNESYHYEDTHWILVHVIGEGKLLGFLASYRKESPFSSQEESIMNHASSVIALQWLRKESSCTYQWPRSYSNGSHGRG